MGASAHAPANADAIGVRDWPPVSASGLTGDAMGLELDGEHRMVALKPAFGGNIVAPILSKTFPQMATVRQGVIELAEPNPARVATVETCALSWRQRCHG